MWHHDRVPTITLSTTTPMPKQRPPELDNWLDQEISSLVETVEPGRKSAPTAVARTRRSRRRPARPGSHMRHLVRVLRLSVDRRRTDLLYYAVAVVLSVCVGWLTALLLGS
jgi:hypothetical protein